MDWEHFYNSFRKPDFIAGYEIQNRLGGGAFGDVYKARKHSIGKAYAIKFLKVEDSAQKDAIERELDQVRHFASIDHQNLVTIEDMGVVLGVPYLIMGYAGEDTLARLLRRELPSPERALAYFVQTCRGVLALHDRRLVHFDLKPSNIFLKGDCVRVGDYGLAKLMTDGCQTLSFGRGTPHYMAPEMLRNRADQRADIYSLGVILYETLTGELPYAPPEGGGVLIREEDDPPPFPPDFPVGMRGVVESCLRLDPDNRFSSVTEVLEALGQAARPGDSIVLSPVMAQPPTAGEPGAMVESAGAGLQENADATPGSGELRTTAAELARGAVEVARGVWDGLRSGREPGEPTPAAARPGKGEVRGEPAPGALDWIPAPADRNGDPDGAFDTNRARDPDRESGRSQGKRRKGRFFGLRGPSRSADSAPLPILDAPRSGDRDVDSAPLATGGSLALPFSPLALPTAGTTALQERRPAGTVPVPPRSSGGVLGAMGSGLVLGFEVLLALLAGPVRAGLAGVGRAGDRVLRGVPGLIRGTLRFLLVLALLTVLGALLTMLFVNLFLGQPLPFDL